MIVLRVELRIFLLLVGLNLLLGGHGQRTSSSTKAFPQLDLYIGVDTSASMTRQEFNEVTKLLVDFIRMLPVTEDYVRVAVRTYSDTLSSQYVTLTNNITNLEVEIPRLPYLGAGTRTDLAIIDGLSELTIYGRRGVPKVLVVITDGITQFPNLAIQAVQSAILFGVDVYAVALGVNINVGVLFTMVGPDNIYFQNNILELPQRLLDSARLQLTDTGRPNTLPFEGTATSRPIRSVRSPSRGHETEEQFSTEVSSAASEKTAATESSTKRAGDPTSSVTVPSLNSEKTSYPVDRATLEEHGTSEVSAHDGTSSDSSENPGTTQKRLSEGAVTNSSSTPTTPGINVSMSGVNFITTPNSMINSSPSDLQKTTNTLSSPETTSNSSSSFSSTTKASDGKTENFSGIIITPTSNTALTSNSPNTRTEVTSIKYDVTNPTATKSGSVNISERAISTESHTPTGTAKASTEMGISNDKSTSDGSLKSSSSTVDRLNTAGSYDISYMKEFSDSSINAEGSADTRSALNTDDTQAFNSYETANRAPTTPCAPTVSHTSSAQHGGEPISDSQVNYDPSSNLAKNTRSDIASTLSNNPPLTISHAESRSHDPSFETSRTNLGGSDMTGSGAGPFSSVGQTYPSKNHSFPDVADKPGTTFTNYTGWYGSPDYGSRQIGSLSTPPVSFSPTVGVCGRPEVAVVDGVGYLQHPLECDKYIQCYFGQYGDMTAVTRQCEPGLLYNPMLHRCDDAINVRCFAERCANPTVLHYNMAGTCRAFWTCQYGHPVPTCCPVGYAYFPGRGCLPSPGCMEPCPIPCRDKSVCLLKPDWTSPYNYKMNTGIVGWMTSTCNYGEFDLASCRCSYEDMSHRGCSSQISFTFQEYDPPYDFIRTSNLVVNSGTALFNGNSRIDIPGIAYPSFSRWMQPTITILLRYLESFPFVGNTVLVTSSTCESGRLVVIYVDNAALYVRVLNQEGEIASATILTEGIHHNTWKNVQLRFYDDGFTVSVASGSYVHTTFTKVPWINNISLCGWSIGAPTDGQTLLPFQGQMDDIHILLCQA